MNLKNMLLLLGVVITMNSVGQSRKIADRYFYEFSYKQSAKIYKALVEKKGDTSLHVLSRLADSYYNNAETEPAEFWYKRLVAIYKKDTLESKYLFKYAQVLRSNGKYKKSDSIFLLLASLSNSGVNNRHEELQNEDYLSGYSGKEVRIGVRNLAINTEYSDFGGFLLNGKAYYTSAMPKGEKNERIYKWNNQPFLNIYKATEEITTFEETEIDTVLTLKNRELMPAPITSKFHESNPVFTKDGKTIYFTRNNVNGKKAERDKKNTSNLKIYKASFINGYWVNVKELPFNNDEYSVGHPALSPDEKSLYFVSNMPGGFGSTDIYRVPILGQDEYGTPVNLGENINTSDKEMFPFVGDDNTLYFSSNGHLGLGLLDIFQSTITQDSIYSPVDNLGHPFNSKRDDFSFFITENGKKGFFSSNRKDGKGDDDIYSFYMYSDPPVCAEAIEGIITETVNKTPIKTALVKLLNEAGEVVKETVSNINGRYIFNDLLCGTSYTVLASKLDHKSKVKEQITIVKGKKIKADLSLRPLIIGDQIVINPIYFDLGKSIIREDAQYELETIITVMTNHPEIAIKIEAHTDSRGRKESNKRLSDKRARSTRDYILSRGISADRIISARGYGEAQLLNDCNDANSKKCTEEQHQQNRRSYFYIVGGVDKISERQKEAVKSIGRNRIKKSVSPKKSSFLLFLKRNFKKSGKSVHNKCVRGAEEDCTKNNKQGFKVIDYKN